MRNNYVFEFGDRSIIISASGSTEDDCYLRACRIFAENLCDDGAGIYEISAREAMYMSDNNEAEWIGEEE